MRYKKILGSIAALALAVSAFAGFATTANAAITEYSQNYDDVTDVSTVWDLADTTGTLPADSNGGKYVKITHNSGKNSRGQFTNFGNLKAGTEYAIEFDLALNSNSNENSNFAIKGLDFAYADNNRHYGAGSGYILKMAATGTSSTWTINDGKTVDLTKDKFYHYTVATKDNIAYLTIADGETKLIDNLLINVNGEGGLSGLYWRSGRYASVLSIDNIVVRNTKAGEIPEVKFYSATVNTTRYAKMTTSDGKVYYADVNGKIEILNLQSGAKIDYTLSKVGYESVAGNITIANDNVSEDKPLTKTTDAIYIESEFGNDAGTFGLEKTGRGSTISLGNDKIPANAAINLKYNVSADEKTQYTILLKNKDGKIIAGIMGITKDGLYVFTDYKGNFAANQWTDPFKFNNYAKLSDKVSGDFDITLTTDKTNNAIKAECGGVTKVIPLKENAETIGSMLIGKHEKDASVYVTEISVKTAEAFDAALVTAFSTAAADVTGAPETVAPSDDKVTLADGTATASYAALTDGKTVTTIYIKVANETAARPVVKLANVEEKLAPTKAESADGLFIYQYVGDAEAAIEYVEYEGVTYKK